MKLSELIAALSTIAKESPELLDQPVEINFDTGSFSEAESVVVMDDRVVISENWVSKNQVTSEAKSLVAEGQS